MAEYVEMLRVRKESISTLPIAIVTHPKRYSWSEKLSRRVMAECVAIDNLSKGCEFNHRQALTWLARGNSEWSIVLEDDCIPVPRFRNQLLNALEYAPTHLVSLYLGRGRPPHWQNSISSVIATDVSWLIGTDLLSAVGYAIKTKHISKMLAALDPQLPIDEAISVWAKGVGCKISYTRPSLVDHRYELPSLVTHPDGQPRTQLRKAWFCDEKAQWDKTFIEIPPWEEWNPPQGS